MGRVKRAAGSLLGRKGLEDEGRLQESRSAAARAAADARSEAEHAEEAAQVASRREELDLERARSDAKSTELARSDASRRALEAEQEAIRRESGTEQMAAHVEGAIGERVADAGERLAVGERLEAEEPAAVLDAEAARRRQAAEAMDPDHHSGGGDR